MADQEDALAPQMRRIVEAAGIPEAGGPMEPGIHEHALGLGERERELAVRGELDAARRGQSLGTRVYRIHVEQEPRAIRGPADRLVGEPPLDGQRSVERAPRQMIGGQPRSRHPQCTQEDDAGEDQDQGGS